MPHAPIRRFLLLLSAMLALVPASGAALCVEQSGHLAIELVSECAPLANGNDACMDACRDCEDTPLSVGAAQRASTHVELDAGILPTALPAGTASRQGARVPGRHADRTASTFPNRSPLLRC